MNQLVAGGRGQVLPLFALFLMVLLGLTALAIDVSGALSARRAYRSFADTASLAGAQDLQQGSGRAVTATERTNARTHAMARLVSLLGASSTPTTGTCDPTADVTDCALPGTGYEVSIKTPSPSCVTCNPDRSVQVTVRNPAYGLSFARLFGQSTWNVASTSVAGLTYGRSYTIVTLRPPKRLGATFDVKDISLEGGSVVTVDIGDVGTNANMEYSGIDSLLELNPDYEMWYFDPLNPPLWGTDPPAQRLTELITDPNYQYPSMAGAPTFGDARESEANVAGKPVTTAFVDPDCLAEWNLVDPTRYVNIATTPHTNVYCYEPGAPGVAVMFDECRNTCVFSGNNAFLLALNAGTRFPHDFAGGVRAAPAIDWAGRPVVTSGPRSPTPPILITLFVIKDADCFVPTAPPWQEPPLCDANENQTVRIAGGGGLVVEGAQYMPTDNVDVGGASTTNGRVGQIIAWTLKYHGDTHINQEGVDQGGPGILRLDAACTTPSTPCNSP